MALRDTPPFRADHVGSLLRPPGLLKAREDHAAGRIDDAELRGVEDEAIRDVVTLQRDVGLRSATDGEFRRASWHMDFIYSLDGISKAPGDVKVQFHNEQGDLEFTPAAMKVDGGRLGVSEPIFGDAFEFLKSCGSDGQLPKLDSIAEHGPLPLGPQAQPGRGGVPARLRKASPGTGGHDARVRGAGA
jgi:5-methyltetrahydropteroyltriglutamate--homocysteine methyltransferase